MSLFKHITKIGVPLQHIASLTEEDIIRIEKKLKAEVRMNQEMTQGEVVLIIESLRNDKQFISELFGVDFDKLRSILEDPRKFVYVPINRKLELNVSEGFGQFLSANFQTELNDYVENCFRTDHFYGLYSLLRYAEVLSVECLQLISQRIRQKLIFLTETIRIGIHRKEEKIIAATNPFFYRCLNLLGPIEFESDISLLLDNTIAHVENRRFHFKIVYAMGMFEAVSDEFKTILESNRKLAFSYGVREEEYLVGKYNERGSTKIKKNSRVDANSSKTSWAWFFTIAIVSVVSFYLRKQHTDYREFDYRDLITQYGITPDSSEIYNTNDQTFVKLMKCLHSDSVVITAQKDIPFQLEELNLDQVQTTVLGLNSLDILNQTNRKMLIVARKVGVSTPYFYCLSANEQIKVQPQLTSLRIYSGDNPQLIDYIDANGDVQTHFRFNTFSEVDRWNFDISHKVSLMNVGNGKSVITIRQEDQFFTLDITQLNLIP